jgi:hypothetical protein
MRRVDFVALPVTSNAKCLVCYSHAHGSFVRIGYVPFNACHNHYPEGMRALVRHVQRFQ